MGEAATVMTSHPPAEALSRSKEVAALVEQPPALFQRRIDFHLARKPFSGFDNSGGSKGGGEFRLETLNPSSSYVGPSSNLEPQKGKRQLAESNGLDPELLSFRITFRRIGAGLQNLGNTCFLNSVLQCLTYTEPLAAYLQSGKHQTSCRTTGFCAFCAIEKHVSRALNSTGRIVAPKDLVSNLRCISRNFRNSRQEDAHEYMVNLLESMHKCCLPSGVPSESPSAYERSLVHKIFGGRLRSQVKCLQCNYCSNKFDPFLDLSLEIMKADSLYKALAHFTAKEQLDGGERQYQCQQCKQKVKALKQLTIHKPPHVLAVHLKRFGSHVHGQKIDKRVAFGPTLDLKPYVTGSYDGDLRYTLYGVLVHAGWSTHSGHYYCFVRTSSGMWYSLDDNQVVQVSERKVLEQKAYMLFYVRDQRNSVPKSPIDVVQHDNMFKLKLGVGESILNDSIEGKSKGTCSHASAQRDAINGPALSKGPKGGISANNNALMADKNLSLRRDALGSPNLSTQKDSIDPTLNVGNCLKQQPLSGKAFNSTLHNGIMTTVHLENGDQQDIIPQLSAKKERSDPCATISYCNSNIGVDKAVCITVDRPLNLNILLGASGKVPTAVKADFQKLDFKEKSFVAVQETPGNNADNSRSHGVNDQVGISSKICGFGESDGQKAPDVDQGPRDLATLGILSLKNSLDKTRQLGVKKKLFKSRIAKMHLSTNIIFGAALGLRKWRKLKKSRSPILANKSPRQEHFANGCCNETDRGPSTSENFKMVSRDLPTCCRNKRKKGDNSAVKDYGIDNDIMQRKMDEECRARVGRNGTVSTDKRAQTDHGCSLLDHQSVTRDYKLSDQRKDVNQKGLIRVLEETTVAQWDGVELLATGITKSGEVDNINIGYVADEWDEEYDKGKRKKVRTNKVNFDGPNPFQEIASRKTKKIRAKLDSNSGTKPFRI